MRHIECDRAIFQGGGARRLLHNADRTRLTGGCEQREVDAGNRRLAVGEARVVIARSPLAGQLPGDVDVVAAAAFFHDRLEVILVALDERQISEGELGLVRLDGRIIGRDRLAGEVAADFANGAILPRAVVATAFFVDIRGFTTTTERLKPEATIAWLNQGLSTMSDAIMANQGVITRFAGDAMMALFGSPIPRLSASHQASDAESAVRAGLAIGANLDKLNKKFADTGQPLLRVRVGIQTGPMVQGSIGGSDRMEFTVLGDAVNTASRLESYAMDDDGNSVRILIGEPTFEMIGHKFETKIVGDLVLKGKVNTVKVYQVTAAIQQGSK